MEQSSVEAEENERNRGRALRQEENRGRGE